VGRRREPAPPAGALPPPRAGADNPLVDDPACSLQPEAAMSRTLLALLLCLATPLTARPADPEPEVPEGFKALFNGKDLTGWKIHGGKLASWGADKGVLFVKGGGGGWLMTDKEYGDFELRLEFKVPKGGNSGVALRSPLKGDPAYTGMEIQILDDP